MQRAQGLGTRGSQLACDSPSRQGLVGVGFGKRQKALFQDHPVRALHLLKELLPSFAGCLTTAGTAGLLLHYTRLASSGKVLRCGQD